MKRFAKKLSCFLFAIIIGSIPVLGVQAVTITAEAEKLEIQSQISSISSDISEAVLLSEDEIEDLVNYQIETYIATEFVDEEKDISPGEPETWIPLSDLEGALFAYVVPLVENTEGEIGYITMGAIEDGFTKYMLVWSTELLESYRDLLEISPDAMPVFFPPMQYGYMTEDENGTQIFALSNDDSSFSDVTESIAQNAEQLTASYGVVRSSENATRLENSLAKAKQIQMGGSARASARVAVEDVRLSCEWEGTDQFVRIYAPNDGYTTDYAYGGDQNWYTSSARRNNGCGPVAASNVLYYMSSVDSDLEALFPYFSLTRSTFLSFMNDVYEYVSPAAFGEISLSDWANDVIDWASDHGVSLDSNPMTVQNSKTTCANYIKTGLRLDRPVGSLNLAANWPGSTQAWHWVTITKYYQGSDDNRWLAISSVGERVGIDWDAYYANMASSILDGGFAYFNVLYDI